MVSGNGLSYTCIFSGLAADQRRHWRASVEDLRERAVRNVYIALIVALVALVLVFTFQNFQTATLSLFSASVTLPISLLIIAIYVLGMLTGGLFLALLRSWIGGARRRD